MYYASVDPWDVGCLWVPGRPSVAGAAGSGSLSYYTKAGILVHCQGFALMWDPPWFYTFLVYGDACVVPGSTHYTGPVYHENSFIGLLCTPYIDYPIPKVSETEAQPKKNHFRHHKSGGNDFQLPAHQLRRVRTSHISRYISPREDRHTEAVLKPLSK